MNSRNKPQDAFSVLVGRLDEIWPRPSQRERPFTVPETRDYTMRVLLELRDFLMTGKGDDRLDSPVHAINHLMLALNDLDATRETAPILKPSQRVGGKRVTTIAAQRRTLVKRCIDYIVCDGQQSREAAFEQVAHGVGVSKPSIKSDYLKITKDDESQQIDGVRALITDDDLRGAFSMLRELYRRR